MELKDQIKVYPNPTSGLVTLEIDNSYQSELSVEVINTNGQIIYSNKYNYKHIVEQLDLNSYSDGMYFVKIFTKEFIDVKKLILNK